jgi:hypothetical protein
VGTGFKLAERRFQAGERLFAAAAAPEEKAEICDDLAFVVMIVELTEDGGSLLETIERPLVVAGVAECQREVIERHRLAASLAEPADEFQSVCVGRNCSLSVAAPTQVRTAGVETSGLPAWVGRGLPPCGSQALPPDFVGPVPCDQSASCEKVPPARDGALENPHASHLAGHVLPAREREEANPTGGGEKREEGEEGEGDELAEPIAARNPRTPSTRPRSAANRLRRRTPCGVGSSAVRAAARTRFPITSAVSSIT